MGKGKGMGRGMAGGMGGGGMMAQIKKLQEQMEAAQDALASETVTATVGGGAVKVTMTGAQVCQGIEKSTRSCSRMPMQKCCRI